MRLTRECARQVLTAGGKGQTVLDGGRGGYSVFTGRLPTMDEWGQACQGADGRTYPWGKSEPNNRLANCGRKVGQLRRRTVVNSAGHGDPLQPANRPCATGPSEIT